MPSNSRALTVLVIAHDDSATLAATIDRLYRALTITVDDFQIVVFDDGSTDDTGRIAEALCSQYSSLRLQRNDRRRGLGYCAIEGSRQGDTPYVVYIPADNTWPSRSFVELFGNIGKADVITSYAPNLLRSMPWPRRLVTHSYTLLLNALFRRHMRYYNGLTIYPVAYLRQGPIATYGFGFQAEALIKAIAAGYSFLEVPVPVDAANVAQSRSLTIPNTLSAAFTILRLAFEIHVLRRAGLFQLPTLPAGGSNREAADLGVGEIDAVGGGNGQAEKSRGPLRILVVGASSGIGANLARQLAADGHRLFICARRADRLAEVAAGQEATNTYVCDISKEDEVAEMMQRLAGDAEGIDVLINCAGIFGEIGPLELSDSARWWRTFEVNLFGVYLVTKHALPLLKKGRLARIVNFAGGGAFSPFANYTAYACSKTAVVRLTECLADELLPLGIRINSVAPGFVATEMHKATLEAGEQRAGRMQYRRTQAILDQGGAPMESIVDCVRVLISHAMDGLTGKTISSNFDPWQTGTFRGHVDEISRSDLYTLRRINIVNLPEGRLRSILSHPWAEKPPKRS